MEKRKLFLEKLISYFTLSNILDTFSYKTFITFIKNLIKIKNHNYLYFIIYKNMN